MQGYKHGFNGIYAGSSAFSDAADGNPLIVKITEIKPEIRHFYQLKQLARPFVDEMTEH